VKDDGVITFSSRTLVSCPLRAAERHLHFAAALFLTSWSFTGLAGFSKVFVLAVPICCRAFQESCSYHVWSHSIVCQNFFHLRPDRICSLARLEYQLRCLVFRVFAL
jgi:hypothetical protein